VLSQLKQDPVNLAHLTFRVSPESVVFKALKPSFKMRADMLVISASAAFASASILKKRQTTCVLEHQPSTGISICIHRTYHGYSANDPAFSSAAAQLISLYIPESAAAAIYSAASAASITGSYPDTVYGGLHD